MTNAIYIASAARTPIGSFNGGLAAVPATALGSAAIAATIERAGISKESIDEVLMGNVISAGLGQNPARQASIAAGLANTVGATTVSKVCGSGLQAVMFAAQAIQCGHAHAIVAGGMENMSRAPYLLEKARQGLRLGNTELIDSLLRDGLTDAYGGLHMGVCGDRAAAKYDFTREQQDDYAIASNKRAQAAIAGGVFAREIVQVILPDGKSEPVTEDEQPKRFNEEKLRKLRPVFDKAGTVTAGNASSLNDGAAACVVISKEKSDSLGIRPLAKILGYCSAAREPEWFTLAPISAMRRLLDRLAMKVADVDLFEINEAFSSVPMAAMRDLSIPHEKVNVHGGAVALGHPLGASGARVLVTLIHALQERKLKTGVASLCIGGGEAVAMAIELC